MSCHYTKQDGFDFFTDKDGRPDFIVYRYGSVSETDGTPIEDYIRRHGFKKFIVDDNAEIGKIADSLSAFPELEAVRCYFSKGKYDAETFNRLPNLKELSCNLENVKLRTPLLESLRADFGRNSVISAECRNLKKVGIMRCKNYEAFWEQMRNLPAVEKIEIGFGTLADFSAFRELPKLEELKLVYLKKLADISGIKALSKTLKRLWFDVGAGTGITDWSPLAALSELEELVICNRAVISDLHFLEPLKNLKDLGLFSVKITAEDLTPLKTVPQVSFYGTGIDRKLKAFLSETQEGR